MKCILNPLTLGSRINLFATDVYPLQPIRKLITQATLLFGLLTLAAVFSQPTFAEMGTSNGDREGDVACELIGQIIPSANTGDESVLMDLDVVAVNDVWAVGYFIQGETHRTHIQHWDGNAWSVVSSPNVGSGGNSLAAIDSLSASSIWAVGSYADGGSRTLILRWDGNAWSVVSSPNPGASSNYLSDVKAISATDVWAVGTYDATPFKQSLTLHWTGAAWSVVDTPTTIDNSLAALSVVSANDIWAVGGGAAGKEMYSHTLHWNGSTWSIVNTSGIDRISTPDGWLPGEWLFDVEAVSANDVWAVGENDDRTLIRHWNGTAWTTIPSPNIGMHKNTLLGLDAVGTNNVWAVGY